MPNGKSILLVEDNESDEAQALRSIRRSGLDLDVAVARDGVDACEMLADPTSRFSLVLLDIKLPKQNGFEVLRFLKSTLSIKHIPVIVLTSSSEPCDIARATELGANSYIEKQIDPEISDANLKIALYYWLMVDRFSKGVGSNFIEVPRLRVG